MNFSAILYTPREMTLSLLRRAVDSPKIIVASHGAENWARKKTLCENRKKKRNRRKLLSEQNYNFSFRDLKQRFIFDKNN